MTFVSLEMVGNLYHPNKVAVLHVKKHKTFRVCCCQKGSVGVDANLGENGTGQIHQQYETLWKLNNINDDIIVTC